MDREQVTILLVDDDEVDVMLVKRAFKDAKIANPVVHAIDGLEALEKLKSGEVGRPFLILLDLNMPRMGGHEFLDELRNNENYREFRDSIVFVMTTSKADEDRSRAYHHNVAGYLVKGEIGDGFTDAVMMLDSFWRVVAFP